MVLEKTTIMAVNLSDLEDDFPILELILRNYLSDEDIMSLRKAYFFAYDAHKDQFRRSGEPYISHPISVAEILAQYQLDVETIMAAILHDVLEDTNIEYEDLAREFGDHVATMVQGVTKFNEMSTAYRKEEEVENLRRMLIATANDLHVIMIKLADRLHNMRTLHFLPRDKQTRIAKNTLDIFAPLAHRLGLGKIKWELEDLCLMYLLPHVYQIIKNKISQKRQEREQYIASSCDELETALKKKNINCTVEGRAKHFYSIYRKMLREKKTFEDLYDLIALRVICETIGECYAILGEVHTMWRQVEGRFKDYISTPKPNNYRSIHTTVLGPNGRLIEIQIRTQDMHYIAEYGIAAHWRYKDEGKRKLGRDAKWLEPFSQELLDTHDPEEFLQAIRHDLFSDEIFVYTPKGELIRLPNNSTPIDFAYKIHTQLGHRCGGAKVNGRMVSLNYSLKIGDVVEILSNQNSHPSPAWLDIVRTSSARNKIRKALLESRREELLKIGQSNLTREIQKAGFNPLEFYNSDLAEKITESLKQKSIDDLFVNIGFGRISSKQVIARMLQQKGKPAGGQKTETSRKEEETEKQQESARYIVRMGDIDDIMYRRAKCCGPIPGDDIIGFVTRGRGVTIHKSTCPNMKYFLNNDRGRIMNLFWKEDQEEVISVTIEIRARDRKNLLVDLSQMISSTGTNIIYSNSETINTTAVFVFTLEITNSSHLNTIMQQLLGIEGVKNVRRLRRQSNPMRH